MTLAICWAPKLCRCADRWKFAGSAHHHVLKEKTRLDARKTWYHVKSEAMSINTCAAQKSLDQHRGFPCSPLFLVDMLSPTSPAKRVEPSSGCVRPVPAFPQSRQGRPSHRVFRGRLGVHACYGLPTCSRPKAGFCLPSFDCFVTSTPVGIATRPGRPLPGQDTCWNNGTFTAHLDQHTKRLSEKNGLALPRRSGVSSAATHRPHAL